MAKKKTTGLEFSERRQQITDKRTGEKVREVPYWADGITYCNAYNDAVRDMIMRTGGTPPGVGPLVVESVPSNNDDRIARLDEIFKDVGRRYDVRIGQLATLWHLCGDPSRRGMVQLEFKLDQIEVAIRAAVLLEKEGVDAKHIRVAKNERKGKPASILKHVSAALYGLRIEIEREALENSVRSRLKGIDLSKYQAGAIMRSRGDVTVVKLKGLGVSPREVSFLSRKNAEIFLERSDLVNEIYEGPEPVDMIDEVIKNFDPKYN